MKHNKFFWQIISLSSIWVLVLVFGIFNHNQSLNKLIILLSLIFLVGFMIFVFQLLKEEKQETKITLSILQNIFDLLNEGIVIYHKNKIIFANKKFLSLVKLDLSEILNLELGTWLTENPRYQLLGDVFYPFVKGENIKLISKNPEVLSANFLNPKRHFLISYTNVKLDQEYETRIITDLTKEVIQKKEEREFISLITHHLRTPLNEIRWFLESLKEESLEDFDRKNLQVAKITINQLILIIEKLLLFVRSEDKIILDPKLVFVKNNLEKIISSLKHLIQEKRLSFKVLIDPAADTIAADERLFYIFLYTFLENAVIYNKIGGEVIVKVEQIKERPYNLISVKDTGIGISEEDLKKLFQTHFRSQEARKIKVDGFGLGLFLAKKIANWHNAEIKVQSEKGRGTTFEIYWPRKLELVEKEIDFS